MLRLPLTAALTFSFLAVAQARAPLPNAPSYTPDGSLKPPPNYREWIYLSSGIDMSYNPQPAGASTPAHSVFDNVFVNPEAYRAFVATGKWPDKTVLVLEVRAAESPISINKAGHTQSAEVRGLEFHVKDKGQWAFYAGDKTGGSAKLIPKPAACYTCHEAHAAVDTTFVQFYPTLMPIAQASKTLSPQYLSEMAAPDAAAK